MPPPLRAKRPARTAAEHDSFPRPVGHSHAISKPNERPDLDDVMRPTEEVHLDRREHAKEAKHRDDAELERRTRHERGH
jgi:hypothetical protein